MKTAQRRILLVALVALLLGVCLGLMLGWQVFPVKWTDTDPVDLRLRHKETFVLAVADSFVVNNDAQLAQDRLAELTGPETSWQDVANLVGHISDAKRAQGDEATALRLETLRLAVALPDAQPMQIEQKSAPPSWVSLLIYAGLLLLGLAILVYLISRVWAERPAAAFIRGSEQPLPSNLGGPPSGMGASPLPPQQAPLNANVGGSPKAQGSFVSRDMASTSTFPPRPVAPVAPAPSRVSEPAPDERIEPEQHVASLQDDSFGEELVSLMDEELEDTDDSGRAETLSATPDEPETEDEGGSSLAPAASSPIEEEPTAGVVDEPLTMQSEYTVSVDDKDSVMPPSDEVADDIAMSLGYTEDDLGDFFPSVIEDQDDIDEEDVLGSIEEALAQRESDLAEPGLHAGLVAPTGGDAAVGMSVPQPPPPAPVVEPSGSFLAQFESEYLFGEDDFDSSFSIESDANEFLGEVGMGTSDLLAADDVQKVDAFEVWLFDKRDIVTKSKFVVSEYALRSEALRAQLAAKGELIKAEVGKVMILETGALRLRATILDVRYQPDEQYPDGVFGKLSVSLTVETKD